MPSPNVLVSNIARLANRAFSATVEILAPAALPAPRTLILFGKCLVTNANSAEMILTAQRATNAPMMNAFLALP